MNRDDILKIADEAQVLGNTCTVASVERIVAAAVKREREACARECETTSEPWAPNLFNDGCRACAKAIRARGE